MSLVYVFIAGCVFFPFTFCLFMQLFKYTCKEYKDSFGVALRIVSAIQACSSCTVGYMIASSCSDIMRDQHHLTNAYATFAFPYFYYDIIVMYMLHTLNYPEVKLTDFYSRIKHFSKHNRLMVMHHLVLPAMYLPVILVYRHGVGDYFIGVFYLMELPIPFISLYAVMVQLNLKDATLYPVVGLTAAVLFGVTRLGVFPYLYWSYARYSGISITSVPGVIPTQCNVACVLLSIPQLYWFVYMIRKMFKYVKVQKRKT